MSDDPLAEAQSALAQMPRLPQFQSVLNANMDPMEMVAIAEKTEKYQVDTDFHLMTDVVFGLLTVISDLEGKIERLANKDKT